MANIAYKYRLYPNVEQQVLFAKTFGCCRKIWNLMLTDRNEAYQKDKAFIEPTPASYKKDYPFLKEVDSLALANVQLNQKMAFKEFFKSCKAKKNDRGFPKFKSAKKSKRSYTTNNQNGTIEIGDDFIKLPKIGKVKAVIHRKPDAHWSLKSATVSQSSDGNYWCSVLFEYENQIYSVCADTDKAIGLDYKSDGLYCDSNGNIATRHKFYRESQTKLAKEQRKLSRKKGNKKGEAKSNNFLKQQKRVNKIHRHIANQRNDFLHKASTEIVNRYDVVAVEDLNMRSLSNKGFGNGKATMDNGYGMFLNMLEYKLNSRGKYFVKVDRFYPSSQTCHTCGYINPEVKNLSIRKWTCPACGAVHDRDINAAVNIRDKGLRLLSLA